MSTKALRTVVLDGAALLSSLARPIESLLNTMVENPILIERAIVLARDEAALGRPPKAVPRIL